MRDYARDYSGMRDATQFLKLYAARLDRMSDLKSWSPVDRIRKHDHVVATRAALTAYASEMRDILKTPKDEHEAHLNELLAKIDARLADEPLEPYNEDMTIPQVVCAVADSVRHDLRAVSDHFITRRLEEGL